MTTRTPIAERLTGAAKKFAGRVLGKPELAHEGELHERKADALAAANQLDAEAERRAHAAHLEARSQAVDREREQLANEEFIDRSETEIERERQAAERDVQNDAGRHAEAARAELAVHQRAADDAETDAERARADGERLAARLRDEAELLRHSDNNH